MFQATSSASLLISGLVDHPLVWHRGAMSSTAVLLLMKMMMVMGEAMTVGLTIHLSPLTKFRGNPQPLLFSCFLLDHSFSFFPISFSLVTWEGRCPKPMVFQLLEFSPSSQAFMRRGLHIMHGEVQRGSVLLPFLTTRLSLSSNFCK